MDIRLWAGGVMLAVTLVGQVPAASPPEAAAFDFWIGEWVVTRADGELAGRSRIEAINGGKALLENWSSASGNYAGKSLNAYDVVDRRWKQFWVDTSGLVLELSGNWHEGKMVLAGQRHTADGTLVQDRITWTPRDDGTVRQVWEHSADGGTTWQEWFNGIYRPAADLDPESEPPKG